MAISAKPLQDELAKRAFDRTKTPFEKRQTMAIEGIYDELTKLSASIAAIGVTRKK